jgi:aryl-alcohol dehydrogenase-like predicted oxidoreductase
MDYVALGKGGPKVSAVGMGMWQAGGPAWGSDVNDDDCIAAMVRARELGINLFDTAEYYGDGHSEEVVGRAAKEMGRDEVFIATKVGGEHLRYDDVLRACDLSLKRLGVTTIDLYQIHWPDPWDQVPLKHAMRAMEKLLGDGKVQNIGVSNFAVRDLREAQEHLSRADIVSNQVQYSLLHREIEEEVIPFCRSQGITILAWSPLAKGLVSGKYGPGNRPTDQVRTEGAMFRPENLREVEKLVAVLREIGGRHGKTPAQVALNWLVSQGDVVPIPGAKRASQAEENAGGVGWKLTRAEVERLDAASRALKLDRF